ncbi:peptidyl-tRNA hydrolase [Striga asiatica]|uniref:Peptidyl-tRNA hydrolase n=1 Tax=Striga asiatica TaxID=4170 RepID=A0A5A7R4E9_STRAF|nr:peptidyl-tRNA hydrolase [Striga asiatica]
MPQRQPRLDSADKNEPFPAEVSRTIVELSSVGTLSTLTQDGSPLGYGVRFAVDVNGIPVSCFNEFDVQFSPIIGNQLDQSGMRTPQCTIQGNLEKPVDRMALKRSCSAWKKRFKEDVEESCIHVIDVERILRIEDYAQLNEVGRVTVQIQDDVWVSSSEYGSAKPDPPSDCRKNLLMRSTPTTKKMFTRFCNIYVDLDFQVT